MYLLTVLAIIFSAAIAAITSGQGVWVLPSFIDMISLVLIIIITLPIMISANLSKDFNKAFQYAYGKKEDPTLAQIRKAREAVELMRKILLYAGIFTFLISCVIIFREVTDPTALGPNISVALLTLLYGVGANMFLLPVAARLKVKIIEFMQE